MSQRPLVVIKSLRRQRGRRPMTRPLHALIPAIGLIGFTIWWTILVGGPSPCADGCDREGTGIDLGSLDLLGDKRVQEKLDLSDDQRYEVTRRLALCLNADQKDLIQMILGQYHADQSRLGDLEDPLFDDDEEGMWDERNRLQAMAGGFETKATTLIDRVLTPVQRDALGPQRTQLSLEDLSRNLTALQKDTAVDIAAALTARQRDQFRQITLEAVWPEVAGFKLSRDQEARVSVIRAKARAHLDQLRAPNPISPAYRHGDDLEIWMRPRLSIIRKESTKILSEANENIRKALLR
jgi:hypothetical protein